RALEDQLEYNRQQDEAAQRRAQENADRHYLPPEETEARRPAPLMNDRAAAAKGAGVHEGAEDYHFFMATGRPPSAPREKAARTLDDYIADETRRRNALLKNPRTAKQVPDMEPVETTARRNMQNAQKAAAEQKSGAPVPEPPSPPKPKGLPGAAGGAVIGEAL